MMQIYRAESEALMTAISMVEYIVEKSCVVFLTDALSVIQALTNKMAPQIARALHQLSDTCRVAVQWIPAHWNSWERKGRQNGKKESAV